MKTARELLEEYNKIEQGLEFSEKVRYNEDKEHINLSETNFDDFDWSDTELKPSDLPKWVQSEINSNIPRDIKDGDIRSKYIGDFIFQIKYIRKSELDYRVIDIKRIKGIKP